MRRYADGVLQRAHIQESDEVRPGVVADFDAEGQVVRFEVFRASKLTENPRSVELALPA